MEARGINWEIGTDIYTLLYRGSRICLQCRQSGFNSWVGKIPWRREWLPIPVLVPAEFCGQRSLAGYSSWGCKESDMTEWLTLSHMKQVTNKDRLYSTGNSTQYSVIAYMRGRACVRAQLCQILCTVSCSRGSSQPRDQTHISCVSCIDRWILYH